MILEIAKKAGLAKINEALKKIKPGKQFNAKKHCGKVKWDVDGQNYFRSGEKLQEKICVAKEVEFSLLFIFGQCLKSIIQQFYGSK